MKKAPLRAKLLPIVFLVAVPLLLYAGLWADVLYAKTFTPHLLEAVKEMSFAEALFSPKHVFHLWIAVHVTESPLLSAIYVAIMLVAVVVAVKVLSS